jgi:two-component system, cell cycle response regulator
LNEEQIVREAQLNNGDRIKVGPTILKYLSGLDAEAKYHEEIYRMTIVDGLTQIHNKRYLFEALDKELIRARRYERQLGLLIFDIDYFKRINDQYGHLAGDYVLRELARIVQERIRREEVFARYGGEEFVIVLPETPMQGAVTLAENLRGRVASHPFVFQGERIPVTISVGCAMLAEEKGATELIQRADEKLYEAKRGGRNRVCW